MDLRYYFQKQILRQCRHLRPILDIRAKLDLHRRIRLPLAVEYTVRVDLPVEMILPPLILHIHSRRRSQEALVRRRRRDRTRIHKSHGRDLTALQLRAFTVGEVPR